MPVTYDDSEDFLAADSLFAELEGESLDAGAARLLPFLGMARCELTDYGLHLPSSIVPAPDYGSFEHGVGILDGLLAKMAGDSTRLHDALRVRRAHDILHEGMARQWPH